MKILVTFLLISAIVACGNIVSAQSLQIAQSMQTTDQQALPAQFNVTFPKDKRASFLINIGASYDIPVDWQLSTFAVSAEYHRNSLTDSAQNNFQFGVDYTKRIVNYDHQRFMLFLIADPKYSWDGIEKINSAESNFLLTPKFRAFGKVNIGKPSYLDSNAHTFYFSFYAGTQVQQVFASDTTSLKGFILRPLAKGLLSYAWNRYKDGSTDFDKTSPLIKIHVNYDVRRTVVNSTTNGERFSHLLNAGVNYFLPIKGPKVSFGVSFVEGSDYFSGLKSQQYFLASLNLAVGGN
ncbi:MAG: hypothetical protein JWR09_5478 [Mucilaginibacter sp.]|nr:hypothetical protein [Mucilaginibacter sp.]